MIFFHRGSARKKSNEGIKRMMDQILDLLAKKQKDLRDGGMVEEIGR